MLGCEGVKVKQYFYQTREAHEKMISHNPQVYIDRPEFDINFTIYNYDLGKHIPLQLILDIFEQSKYFRLTVGQVMKIIQHIIENIIQLYDRNMFYIDLDPKNIWIHFISGQLGPQFIEEIDFKIAIQIQSRLQYQNVENYNDKIQNIVYQLTKIMDKSIPKKQRKQNQCELIQKLQKEIYNIFPIDSLNQLKQQIQILQNNYQKSEFKIEKKFFDKRQNRIKDAKYNIQQIFKDDQPNFDQKQNYRILFHQNFQFFRNYEYLIDFCKHFSQQLHNVKYSDFKKNKKQEMIDFDIFSLTQRKIQESHPFNIGRLHDIPDNIILDALNIRGYLNYPNNQVDPTININSLIKDFVIFSLSETQKIHQHFNSNFKIDKENLQNILGACKNQITSEILMFLARSDIKKFQHNKEIVQQFQEKIFKQYENKVQSIFGDLF